MRPNLVNLFVCVCSFSSDCFVLFGIVLRAWEIRGILLGLSLLGTTKSNFNIYMRICIRKNMVFCSIFSSKTILIRCNPVIYFRGIQKSERSHCKSVLKNMKKLVPLDLLDLTTKVCGIDAALLVFFCLLTSFVSFLIKKST